ncbi:MAG: hypothetical protein WC712_08060 [Candidatus Brocadiia bacterium]
MTSSDKTLGVLRIRLATFVETQGTDILKDRAKCIPLLRDALASEAPEAKAIIAAFDSNVPGILAGSVTHATADITMDILKSNLAQKERLSTDLAGWVVESWAIALGIVGESRKNSETHVVPPVLYAPPMAHAKHPSDRDASRPRHKNFDSAASPMPMPIRLGSMGGVRSTEAQATPEMHVPTGHLAHTVKKFKFPHLSTAGWSLRSQGWREITSMVVFGSLTGGFSGLLAGMLYAWIGLIGAIVVSAIVFTISSLLYYRLRRTLPDSKPPVLAWTGLGIAIGCLMFFPEYDGSMPSFMVGGGASATLMAWLGSMILIAIFHHKREA